MSDGLTTRYERGLQCTVQKLTIPGGGSLALAADPQRTLVEIWDVGGVGLRLVPAELADTSVGFVTGAGANLAIRVSIESHGPLVTRAFTLVGPAGAVAMAVRTWDTRE